MENYRIYFENGEQEQVLRILRQYNDVLIDNVNRNSIGITIETSESDTFYMRLMDRIDQQVFASRPHHRYY